MLRLDVAALMMGLEMALTALGGIGSVDVTCVELLVEADGPIWSLGCCEIIVDLLVLEEEEVGVVVGGSSLPRDWRLVLM